MHKQKAGRRTTSGGRGQGFEQFLVVKKSSYTPVDIYQDNIFGCMVYMCTATVHVFLFFHFHTSFVDQPIIQLLNQQHLVVDVSSL